MNKSFSLKDKIVFFVTDYELATKLDSKCKSNVLGLIG